MKRCVRLVALGAALIGMTASVMAASSYDQVEKKISKLKKTATKRTVDTAKTEPTWYQKTFTSWKDYLAKPVATDYLPAQTNEGVSAHFSHSWAKKAFDHTGQQVSPSVLAFGSENFAVRDLFAASNLIANEDVRVVRDVTQNNELPTNSRHFLYLLANQTLGFNAHYSRQEVSLSYERLFLNQQLAFSVDVPLIREEHRLTFDKSAELTRSNRSALVEVSSLNSPLVRSAMGEARLPEAPTFYETYNDMEHFVHRVLGESGIAIGKTQEAIGLGDIKAQLTFKSPLRYVDDARFGAKVSFGTGKTRRNVAVWESETAERSGATNIQLQANLNWHRGQYANPFVHAQLGYTLPVGVARRVPFSLSYDASHPGERMMQIMPRTIPFSDVVKLSHIGFSQEPENNVREVASTVQKMNLHQGLDLSVRIGNTCENCFNRPIYFTVAYDFSAQQGHRVTGMNKEQAFATEVMERNTHKITSTFMAGLGYRLNKNCSVDGSFAYRMAGRNQIASVTCRGGVSVQF